MNLPSTPQLQRMEIRTLNLELNESFAISGGAVDVVELVLFRLIDTAGNIGLGEAAPFPAYDGVTRDGVLEAIPRLDFSFLEHSPPSQNSTESLSWIADQWSSEKVPGPLLAAVEMSWWDLLGQFLQMPVYQFFGDHGHSAETGITIVVGDEIHARKSAERYRDQGFSDLKIKLSGDVQQDLSRMTAVRNAHPECRLLMDANGGFNLADAICFVEELSAHGLEVDFLEQPFPADSLEENRQLASHCPIPILADESCTSAESLRACFNEGAFSGVNLKTQKSGAWESVLIHKAALQSGKNLMIGGMVESPLSMTLSAHLVRGLGSFDWVDLDTPLFMKEHPFKGGIQFDSSIVQLKTDPGLGISLNPDFEGWASSEWIPVWQREK
ncbi:MAG: dipeptide epimerase [Planctomycetota bacterium]